MDSFGREAQLALRRDGEELLRIESTIDSLQAEIEIQQERLSIGIHYQICRCWREVAEATSELWSSITSSTFIWLGLREEHALTIIPRAVFPKIARHIGGQLDGNPR
ncbi:hypothetical protein K503DRAFT_803359 [Rhizopogon vinicolor AM-OR11-026]|uniref:Uncharacterized protein n=1 Tax=Rhizopogon vinicolor AM-OR11-026 TaxID=1314800 RepID=A0A1B7MQ42_9AGAM|nr:hypothetical protein K503DRAFT_803359 [Rhizopogon vinicolor AM-OR11-026]